jgi:hypothetical protein
MATRRDNLILNAFNPTTKRVDSVVQVSFERMKRVGRRSLGHASEAAFILPYVLKNPSAIFEGIRREIDEDDSRGGAPGWRCYCAIPLNAFRSNGDKIVPYEDQVYVVFVNHDNVAYNWRWEKSDPQNSELPHDHAKRFTRRLYPL